jgi:NTE family protein
MKTRWKNLSQGVRRALDQLRRTVQPRPLPPPKTREPKLGLALGGGFARGMAHIGVIKALEEAGLRIDYIAGTSVGSIIAGAYASGATVEEMTAFGTRVRWHDFGKWTFSKMGLASNNRLEALVKKLFHAAQFEDLKIPLAIIAADLATGRPVVFKKGELALPIRASCAYPGLFLPVENDGCQLIDGGLVRTVPTLSARDLGADVVLGVGLGNINPDYQPRHIAEVLARSFSIAMQAAEPIWRKHADLVVEPKVDTFAWDDFAHTPELVEAGYAATLVILPELKKLLGIEAAVSVPSA